jgi:hypothetical protein
MATCISSLLISVTINVTILLVNIRMILSLHDVLLRGIDSSDFVFSIIRSKYKCDSKICAHYYCDTMTFGGPSGDLLSTCVSLFLFKSHVWFNRLNDMASSRQLLDSLDFIDVDSIQLKSPKKYEDMYLCKINYHPSETVKSKLMFHLANCKIHNVRKLNGPHIALFLGISKKAMRKIITIEDRLMDIIKDNAYSWFNQKTKDAVLEDYFQRSVVVDRHLKRVLRCKFDMDVDDVKELKVNDAVDVDLHIEGLRFYKQSLSLIWRIHRVYPLHKCMFIDNDMLSVSDDQDIEDDRNEEGSVGYAEEVYMGPSQEDIYEMIAQAKTRVPNTLLQLEVRYEALKKDITLLKAFVDKHEADISLRELDDVTKTIADYDE